KKLGTGDLPMGTRARAALPRVCAAVVVHALVAPVEPGLAQVGCTATRAGREAPEEVLRLEVRTRGLPEELPPLGSSERGLVLLEPRLHALPQVFLDDPQLRRRDCDPLARVPIALDARAPPAVDALGLVVDDDTPVQFAVQHLADGRVSPRAAEAASIPRCLDVVRVQVDRDLRHAVASRVPLEDA